MLKVMQMLKEYWIVVVIGVVVAGMLTFMSSQGKALSALAEDVDTTKAMLADAEKKRQNLDVTFDQKKHQKKVKERTVSATKIGGEIIVVDDALTAFYKTNEPLPESKKARDALFAKVEKMKDENTRLTGATEADHIKTWQLNPEWTLKLDSVVTYQDTDTVPLVFSMKTKAGETAGLIFANYNVNDHTLDKITRYYTTTGLEDEVDVGGV